VIPALILTAGLATRLRPLSLVRAKAALPVAGEPLVGRILRGLAAAGVSDAVLNLHHHPSSITGRIGDGSSYGVRVRYSWETRVLGSAGGPRRAVPLLGSPTFLIVNGDTLSAVDVPALVDEHRRSGALVTMAVTPHTEPDRYGGIAADNDGRVRGFVRRGSGQPSAHFVGVQVVEAAALASVPADTPFESVGALYPALLAAQPGCIRTCLASGDFHDIGTPADYLDTALRLAAVNSATRAPADDPLRGERTTVHPTAVLERTVLWDDVTVEAGATLRECVVTDGVRLPAGTSWSGVILRVAGGEIGPDERIVGGLAICPMTTGAWAVGPLATEAT
jgi:NDP-sugar pyrophosphorylase family protein